MRFLSTRTNANEFHKHKIKGNLCCKAQEHRQMRLLSKEQGQMRFLSTITSVNDGAKHKNKGKRG